MQRRIESPLLELEGIAAATLDLTSNGIAVQWRVFENGQHERRRVSFEKFFVSVHNYSTFRGIGLQYTSNSDVCQEIFCCPFCIPQVIRSLAVAAVVGEHR